jgi:hypothetical protein
MKQVELEAEEESKTIPRMSVSASPSKLPGVNLTESMMIDAVADVFLKEMQNQVRSSQTNPLEQSQEYRRIGEEMVMHKIKGILDEVAGSSIG